MKELEAIDPNQPEKVIRKNVRRDDSFGQVVDTYMFIGQVAMDYTNQFLPLS